MDQSEERSEPPKQTDYIGRLIPLWNQHAYLNSEVQYNLLAFRISITSRVTTILALALFYASNTLIYRPRRHRNIGPEGIKT